MSRLVILNSDLKGQGCDFSSFLGQDRITVGRTGDNIFQIPEDSISSSHCELLLSGGGVVVRDLQSRNGTFIDEQAVQEGVLLPGQVLRLGNVKLRLEADEPEPAAPKAGLRSELVDLVKPLDRYRLSPVWRERAALGATGLWAGGFSLFVSGALPYYPQGWRLLLAVAVAGLWMYRPRWGTVLAMLGIMLPAA